MVEVKPGMLILDDSTALTAQVLSSGEYMIKPPDTVESILR
jgi:hypothetical protein